MFIHGQYYRKLLVKINPVKGLLYHLSDPSGLNNFPNISTRFQTKGIKLDHLNIIKKG